jgi:hypothetical protein
LSSAACTRSKCITGVEKPGATGGGSLGGQQLNSESKESLLLVDS